MNSQNYPHLTPNDRLRLEWYIERPVERLSLIFHIATTCYKAYDVWDEEFGVGRSLGSQLAYLFTTIAECGPKGWSFELDMAEEGDGLQEALHKRLADLFEPNHAIWLFIHRKWGGLPSTACPVCAHDCDGFYPARKCLECGFDETQHDFRTYKP